MAFSLFGPRQKVGYILFLEAITCKTFVFIALALGGELYALRRGQFARPAEDWFFILLYSDPSFFPKSAKKTPYRGI